ncbi:hypothetical protein KTC96_16970 [Clostridium estertheticum]|uniref:hypothetical protein n=1 Tax=Clostridium estertheticum TaxID=238834 RepID=UPI001C7D15C6|nr:hypothetical protein [Clostridium estertheticum]MBX4258422.1 hypothetical protein [Clostridium estertheticum]WLC69623.1 hypothetical protein KTC96_16970 [Clostridium estertheticum]
MNKKITGTALAALMIAGSTSFSAFAAMSNGTVVIGNKAFDIDYANAPANATEIQAAITAGGTVYYKDFNGNWIDNVSGASVNASVIPAVTYTDSKGITKYDAADKDAVSTATVKSVSAVNTSTLSLTGTGLGVLKTTDLSVAGNTIASVTASADGTSATVVLGTLVTPNVERTLVVNGANFNFTYKLVADTAAITAATYDNDRANQFAAFSVNGITANVANLLANGYTVKFTATDKDATTDKSAELFANQTTGLLRADGDLAITTTDNKLASEYKVQVTLTNGTNVIVAPVQTVKISNLDLAATSINAYDLVNTSVIGGNTSAVVQKSNTLVVGDTAKINNLKVLIDGTEEKGLAPTKIESSNKAVASIATAAGVSTITANTPGSTTITVTYGNVTKVIALTVSNDKREVTSVKVTKENSDVQIYNTTAIKPTTTKLIASPIDQYGDPMNATTFKIESTDTAIATVGVTSPSDATGKLDLNISAVKAGSATLLFKNDDNKTLSTFGVNVTEDNSVATKKLEIVAPKDADSYKKSADNTVDISDDAVVEYKLNQFNSQGISNGSVNLVGYTATSSDKSVANVFANATANTAIADGATLGSGETLTIRGLKKGTASINLKDVNGVSVGTITVTVVDNGATVTGVSFKPQTTLDYAKTVDYKTFLSTTEAAGTNDPIVSGMTLSKATTNSIRVTTATGILYIDQDGDAIHGSADKDLGKIVLDQTSDSTGITIGTVQGQPNFNSTTFTTGTVSKGTLIFKIMNMAGDKILSSTSLDVNVK